MVFKGLDIELVGFNPGHGDGFDMQIAVDKGLSRNVANGERKVTAFKAREVGTESFSNLHSIPGSELFHKE